MEKCKIYEECYEDKILLMNKNNYPIFDCQRCLRRYSVINNSEIHLSQVYSDDYFFEGKDGYSDYLEEKDILFNTGVRYAKKIGKHSKPGRILDVGCAAGFILNGFESAGWKGQGIEPNATMAAYGKKELNLDIHVGGLEDFNSDQKFDLVSLIQVIGHFYDIDRSMENISNLLRPNGLVLVESWDMKSLIARLFGKNWHEYSPPSVINWFSDKSLKNLFKNYGFKLIDSGYPVKKIALTHAFSLVENKLPNFLLKDKIFHFMTNSLRKMVFIYPPFDLKWYIFQKAYA